jgi:hypothetical protein
MTNETIADLHHKVYSLFDIVSKKEFHRNAFENLLKDLVMSAMEMFGTIL